MTYPLIGNYGVNETTSNRAESRCRVIVKEACNYPSNFYLQENAFSILEGKQNHRRFWH